MESKRETSLRLVNDICDAEIEKDYRRFMSLVAVILPYLPIHHRAVSLDLECSFNEAIRVAIELAYTHGYNDGLADLTDKIS